MQKTTTTVEIGADGRCTIPEPARKVLGVNGEEQIVEMEIRKKQRPNGSEQE